ncbi:MAG: hypothetical protein GY812_01500 [Actinomycetia bacterium]|nr:hypothetical protein [Actinomycetes bacterium]
MRAVLPLLAPLVTVALVAAACTGSDEADSAAGAEVQGATTMPARESGACDDTDPSMCLLPWPNDAYTRADETTATGLRLDLPPEALPTNAQGKAIDPTEWNRNDGFSPASIPQVVVAGLDPVLSGLPAQTDIGASLEAGSNLVVLDLDTGDRVPAWAEVDPHVTDPRRTLLRIVPATALVDGHRHAIGLFDLRDTNGTPIPPSRHFAELKETSDGDREQWLRALIDEGPDADLVSAWSFTVASTESLTGRLSHMWAETAAELGVDVQAGVGAGGAPPFTIESTYDNGPVRLVQGSFEMPQYLTADGGPGSTLNNDADPDGIPTATGTMQAPFTCVVPIGPGPPKPFVVYGHGLLGSRAEVTDIGVVGAAAGVGFCALDFIGMSAADIPTVLEELADLSLFRTQPDRLQQGHLGFLLLARLLASGDGFATHAAFQDELGESVVLPAGISYLGASQGGILGGPITALSPDMDRAVFAVGGMGYNLLLRRSIDFDRFLPALAASYPDELEAAFAIELMQNLWDRGENAGWAQHITAEPLPGSGGATTALVLEAFGDHQVANASTEKLARTLSASRLAPTLAQGRSTDTDPLWGIDPVPETPWSGSALVMWDFGTPPPPASNTPPREGDDPHGKLSGVPEALAMVVAFTQPNGLLIDPCGGAPCSSPG